MKFFSSFTASCISIFGRFERAEVMAFAIKLDARNVEASTFDVGNTLVARGVVALRSAISMVLRRRCFAQVCPAIIRFYFVFMVNLFRRPSTFHPDPNNSMRKIIASFDAYFNSALVIECSGQSSNGRAFGQRFFPAQVASFWIVVKNLSYKCWRQIVVRVFMSSWHAVRMAHLEVAFKSKMEFA
jgi:hypothetical protein